ncbi:solute carrier family 28 member 3-like [Antennarius striatus]|uniref:solute carrier family 28 member 3-like n=1 Tax=Antennarius striatus TaxID=241820 RepID=UPI0035B4F088
MELNEVKWKIHNHGNDSAFDSEIHIDEDSPTKRSDDAALISTDQEKQSLSSMLEKKVEAFQSYLAEHSNKIALVLRLVLAAAIIAIVITACILNFKRAVGLLALSLVVAFFLAWDWLMDRHCDMLWEKLSPVRDLFTRNWYWIRWTIVVLILIAVVCWLTLDTAKLGTRQLISFSGLLFLIFLMLLFSKHPFRWSWRTLLWGMGLQFAIALVTLRTSSGSGAMQWIGDQVEKFLSFTNDGSKFVFGAVYSDNSFVFKVMPILIFLSSVISILYYTGLMQWLICKIGFLMHVTMGTSPPESMAAAGNIFLGQIESSLLIRPYIRELTCSEIHAVMVGGLAGISGTILGAYISFGVEAKHLLTASVMSAPASLAIAKMFWPETETSRITSARDIKIDHGESSNMLEAASQGATAAVGIIAIIVSNLIAFIALLSFSDAALACLGGMLDYPQLSFSLICSYVFMPLSFMMGVSWEDSFIVAELIGLKTFLNEFVAYQKLSVLIKRRKAGGPEYVDNVKQYISIHSETIATYALCGFSNFASLGMTVGVMVGMAPERKADISSCGIRSLIAGSVSCFMTACVAGMLTADDLQCPYFLTANFSNTEVISSSQLAACCTQLFDSVTVHGPLNDTIGDGFSMSNLVHCCSLTPSAHFNCSFIL